MYFIFFLVGIFVFLVVFDFVVARVCKFLSIERDKTDIANDQFIVVYLMIGLSGVLGVYGIEKITEFMLSLLKPWQQFLLRHDVLLSITVIIFLVISCVLHLWGRYVFRKEPEKMPWQRKFKFSFPIMVGAGVLFYIFQYLLSLF